MRSGRGRYLLAGLLAIAALYRGAAWFLLPVVHDEVNVLAVGLSRIAAGGVRDFLFDVPAVVSNGVTPLWFWLQSIPAALFGMTSKHGLRLVPFLLGLLGVAAAFRAGRRIGGHRAGWFAGLIQAASSLMLYTNGHGQFSESLIAPLLTLLLLDLLPRRDGGPVPARAALWPALILFTYVGKGLPIWAAYAACLAAAAALGSAGWLPGRRLPPGRLAALTFLPILPSLAWLLAADALVYGARTPVMTDVGPASSIWDVIRMLTVGYGIEAKEYMVGGWRAALYPYTDFEVWPDLALITVPAIAAAAGLAAGAARAARRRDGEALLASLVPLILAVPVFAALVAKGVYSSRFHVMYLPVVIPYVGAVLDRWLRALERGRWKAFLGGGSAAWIYVCWTFAWSSRIRGTHDAGRLALLAALGVLTMAFAAAAAGLPAARLRMGPLAAAGLSILILAGGASYGALHWGRRLAWEPELREVPPPPIASLPNADLQLVRDELGRRAREETLRTGIAEDDGEAWERAKSAVVARVRPLLLRALQRNPGDAVTLAEAGQVLWTYSAADRDRIVDLWRRHAARRPGDATIADLLRRAESAPP